MSIILKIFPCRKSLIATVEKQLLGEHLTAILQKGNWQFVNKTLFLNGSSKPVGDLKKSI
jgi:hypothetical protein